jgi:hypothetical protein
MRLPSGHRHSPAGKRRELRPIRSEALDFSQLIRAGETMEIRREEQSRVFAAAWRMVSEQKPHEDMRRLKPETDLAVVILQYARI